MIYTHKSRRKGLIPIFPVVIFIMQREIAKILSAVNFLAGNRFSDYQAAASLLFKAAAQAHAVRLLNTELYKKRRSRM